MLSLSSRGSLSNGNFGAIARRWRYVATFGMVIGVLIRAKKENQAAPQEVQTSDLIDLTLRIEDPGTCTERSLSLGRK